MAKTDEVLKMYQAQCDSLIPKAIELLRGYFKKVNPLMTDESINICISYMGFFLFNALRDKSERGDKDADRGIEQSGSGNSGTQGPEKTVG